MRIDEMEVAVETGDVGFSGPVVLAFNRHEMPFDRSRGGTNPGETLEGVLAPRSVAHSVTMHGPEEGEWSIERLTVTYKAPGDTWTVRFGAITLDKTMTLDLWEPPPLPVFDV